METAKTEMEEGTAKGHTARPGAARAATSVGVGMEEAAGGIVTALPG